MRFPGSDSAKVLWEIVRENLQIILLSLVENDQYCYPSVYFDWADYVTVFSYNAQFKVFF